MMMNDYDGQMIFGEPWGLKRPDICLTGEEKPRKNLTQETFPDRGSYPGSLRNRRESYRLLQCGGLHTLLTSSLVPLGSFRSFKVCSDAKERVGCGKQREATAPIKSLVKLLPWFLSLRWKTCLRQNCSLGFSACSEGPAFG